MKKLIILISVIIIFFVFFLYMYFSPRDYEKKYEINKVNITERYNKEKAYYYFNLNYKNKNIEYVTTEKYTTKRGLINKVKIVEDENSICLIPSSEYHQTYPICTKDDAQILYTLTDIGFEHKKAVKPTTELYKDININYLNNKSFLIWNYKGFNYINEDEQKEINILEKDVYNLGLVAQVDKYLLIPDYDSNHTFDKMFVLDLMTSKIDEWKLEYEIYFDSYIVGVENKSVFLFDKKNKQEYELRPDKKKMRKVAYKAIIEDEWQDLSLGDLNKEIKFSRKNVYNYEVTNNVLYLSYLGGNNKILVSSKDVKEIVHVENDTVYYLVDDKLYMYNIAYGEVLLMDYFEWNFNYKNMIYIYE